MKRSIALTGASLLAVLFMYSALLPTVSVFVSAAVEQTTAGDAVAAQLPARADFELMASRVGLKTDDEVIEREEEAMSHDGFSTKELKQMREVEERYEFQAEVNRLMDIIIHSLYKHKEIFLRELISNASDALDKIRFLSLSDDSALGEGEQRELDLRIKYDEEERSLEITDKGIGMTKEDLIQNLGTVAKSGTTNFVEAIAAGADVNLIGQFGVGFYSVYLVADRVQVTSKNNDDDQYIWESTADATFSVSKDPRGNTLGRGTSIKLFLKDDCGEFMEQDRLKDLIKRYSEFITFPIYLWASRQEMVEVPVDAEETEAEERGDELPEDEFADIEEDDELLKEEEEAAKKPATKMEQQTFWDWEQVNAQSAIWTRHKNDVEDSEYINFFKSISKENKDPLSWIHFKAEGEVDFKAILYLPKAAPHDLYDNYYGKSSALRLYVRKVLISDEFEELMPRYLNFIRGLVDSDDLPLNVSRETLQQHKVLKVIGKKLVRKALEMLRKLAQKGAKYEEEAEQDDGDADSADSDDGDSDEPKHLSPEEEEEAKEPKNPYLRFWKHFGKNVKLGLIEDHSNRTKLSKLLRFKSNKSDGELISLEQYVERMKDWQKHIYYIAAETEEAAENSAFLEKMENSDLEVLYFTDPIDEYAIQNLPDYDGHKLQSITKDSLKLGNEDEMTKRREKAYKQALKPLTQWMKEQLGDKIDKVKVAPALRDTPSVLVTGSYGHSANMERIMKHQAFSDREKQAYLISKRIMQINPRHPIVADLAERVDNDPDDAVTKNLALVLHDTAVLNSGFTLDNPQEFALRLYSLMAHGMDLSSMDLLPEIELPDEEDDDAAAAGDDGADMPADAEPIDLDHTEL